MKSSIALFTLAGFWTFFAFGFVDNLKGPLLPEVVGSGSLNYAQAGSLIFANYIGFITATLSSGLLADRLSNHRVLWLAGWCLSLGLLGLGVFTSFTQLIVCMFVMGLGLGAIELGANGLMIELHPDDRGRYLNLLSVFHGCGSFLVPLAAAKLIGAQWNWQTIYGSCALLGLPLLMLFMPWRRSEPAANAQVDNRSDSPSNEVAPQRLLAIGFTPTMWCYYVLIAAYVAVELSIGAWMMEYLQKDYAMSVDQSSRYLSAFFILLMTGRLLGAWIVEQVEYLWAVAVTLIATLACLALPLIIGPPFVWLLPASGLCMSIIFPTITASVSRLHPTNSGAIIGLLFGFSGLGGALGPWLVGLASQQVGISRGLILTLLFNVLGLAALLLLATRTTRKSPVFAKMDHGRSS